MSETKDPLSAPFGSLFGHFMTIAVLDEHGHYTYEGSAKPVENLSLHPGTHALHYASACFEGLKAHRQVDGSLAVFRVDDHVARMVQSIEKLSGEVISSTDLIERQSAIQKQFDEGMIDQAEFQSQNNLLKEVERTRAGKRQVENKLQTTQSDQQRQQTEAQTAQKVEAINSWENNLRQRDPDFGQVTDPSDAKHGESVADQVFDAMSLKFMQKPNVTNEELIQTAQRAYERARKSVPAPALRQQKVVTSQSSSITGKPKPKTMREAMDAVKLD